MMVHAAKPLFARDCLEDSPSLQAIKDLLAALPDGKLLNSLRVARGKGRDDYPVHLLWGVSCCGSPCGTSPPRPCSPSCAATKACAGVIGNESESGVPNKWNMLRFEDVLVQEPHRTLLKDIFNVLIALISHRFSTVRMADVIYVLHKGRLIALCTHGEAFEFTGEVCQDVPRAGQVVSLDGLGRPRRER